MTAFLRLWATYYDLTLAGVVAGLLGLIAICLRQSSWWGLAVCVLLLLPVLLLKEWEKTNINPFKRQKELTLVLEHLYRSATRKQSESTKAEQKVRITIFCPMPLLRNERLWSLARYCWDGNIEPSRTIIVKGKGMTGRLFNKADSTEEKRLRLEAYVPEVEGDLIDFLIEEGVDEKSARKISVRDRKCYRNVVFLHPKTHRAVAALCLDAATKDSLDFDIWEHSIEVARPMILRLLTEKE